MDALKRELERKRKAFQTEFGNRKFVSRGEIERKKIEQIKREEEEEDRRKKVAKRNAVDKGGETKATAGNVLTVSGTKSDAVAEAVLTTEQLTEQRIDALVLPRAEVVKRLRMLKHPATLFGEDDDARMARLKHIMKTGEADADGELLEGQGNDFLRDMKRGAGAKLVASKGKKEIRKEGEPRADGEVRANGDGGEGERGGEGSGDEEAEEADIDSARMKTNFDDLGDYDKILVFFKKLLKEWQGELDARPEAERRTIKGKKDVATYKQCARYLEPLFNLCRKKALVEDLKDGLLTMVRRCMERDYLAATDKYIKLAIGNAPWPIGVTMVGIHERSAREKIHTQSVAHVMNDETTRKYLQSVKRLMTLCQRRYPAMPSKSVEFNSLANGSDLEALLLQEESRKKDGEGEEKRVLLLTGSGDGNSGRQTDLKGRKSDDEDDSGDEE